MVTLHGHHSPARTAWGSDQNAWVSFGKQRWVNSRERRSQWKFSTSAEGETKCRCAGRQSTGQQRSVKAEAVKQVVHLFVGVPQEDGSVFRVLDFLEVSHELWSDLVRRRELLGNLQ